MKNSKVNVAILDDHQSIIDGYTYRLGTEPKIQVVSTARFGEDLDSILSSHPINVLLMDIRVPIVVRMSGTRAVEGLKLLEGSSLTPVAGPVEAAETIIRLAGV